MEKDIYKVGNSPVHGKGLFATRNIGHGKVLGICKTVAPKKSELDSPYVLHRLNGSAVMVVDDLKYINHSAKGNVAYYDDLSVVALKNIKAGQELLHDYGDDWKD